MRVLVGAVPTAAEDVLARPEPDASEVGINYADACLKIFKQTLEDGRKLSCKRRGLRVTLALGERRGEGLLRRLEHGPDVREIFRHAVAEAARGAGLELAVEDGVLYLDTGD